MDEIALLRLRIEALEEQNQLLRQTLVIKDKETQVCACGTPHTLYVMAPLTDEIAP